MLGGFDPPNSGNLHRNNGTARLQVQTRTIALGTFTAHNVTGDGRCLFRALSLAVHDSQDKYQQIIDMTVEHVINQWEDFQPLVEAGHDGYGNVSTPAAYKQFLAQPHTYGTIAEIVAASATLGSRIRIIKDEGAIIFDSGEFCIPSIPAVNGSKPDILLYLSGSMTSGHYKTLRPIQGQDNPVADGGDNLTSNGCNTAYIAHADMHDGNLIQIGSFQTKKQAEIVEDSVKFLQGIHRMPLEQVCVPPAAVELLSPHVHQNITILYEEIILVWMPQHHPLLASISKGFKLLHDCLSHALFGRKQEHSEITSALTKLNSKLNNINANTMLVDKAHIRATMEAAVIAFNAEFQYFSRNANSSDLDHHIYLAPHGLQNQNRKICILFDEVCRRWYNLQAPNRSWQNAAPTYHQFACKLPHPEAPLIAAVQSGHHEDFDGEPDSILVHLPKTRRSGNTIHEVVFGPYTDISEAVQIHDLALMLTRHIVRRKTKPASKPLLTGMAMDYSSYWHALGNGGRWILPPDVYTLLNEIQPRPSCINFSGGNIVWPLAPQVVLSTAVIVNQYENYIPISNTLANNAYSLLDSIAFLLTTDRTALLNWESRQQFSDLFSHNLQSFADCFNISIWLYAEDGTHALPLQSTHQPLHPSNGSSEPARDVYILQRVRKRTFYEPLIPVAIGNLSDRTSSAKLVSNANTSASSTQPQNTQPAASKKRKVLEQAPHPNKSSCCNNNSAGSHQDADEAVPQTLQAQSEQPLAAAHDTSYKITQIVVHGSPLVDFAGLPGADNAAIHRDLAVILTKRRRAALNNPLKSYFHGPLGLLQVPEVVYTAINPYMLRPQSLKVPQGWIFWLTNVDAIFQSVAVTCDKFTFLRSLSLLMHGSETQFRIILARLAEEINSKQHEYQQLLTRVASHRPDSPQISWDGEVQIDANLVDYSQLLCLDTAAVNAFELVAASNTLGADIILYDTSGNEVFKSSSLIQNASFPKNLRLTHCQSGSSWQYAPLKELSFSCPTDLHTSIIHGNTMPHTDSADSSQGFWTPENDNNLKALENYLCNHHELATQDKKAIRRFWMAKHDKLTHICFACERMFFESQVVLSTKCRRQFDRLHPDHPALLSKDNQEWVCNHCNKSIKKDRDSEFSIFNGMHMHHIADALQNMTYLEQRLIAANTPFMSISHRKGWQKALKGGIINVPNDLTQVMSRLPTQANAEATILVHFKRNLQFTSAYCSESIRPAAVIEALKFLTSNCRLWQSWQQHLDEICQNAANIAQHADDDSGSENDHSDRQDPIVDDDAACSDDNMDVDTSALEGEKARQHVEATQHTLVDSQQQLLLTFQHEMNVAPASGSSPVSVFKDDFAEEKAFPCLYGGQAMTLPVGTPYSRVVKWQLCHYDRRFAMNIENIFFKLFKLRIDAVSRLAMFKLRTGKHGSHLTREQALNRSFLEDITRKDAGFLDFKSIRGSPGYFQQVKKDAFAMLRQLGKPTWFFTLSCADTHWPEMQSLLHEVRHREPLTAMQVTGMSYKQRSQLISEDPVTCVRYYHMRCMSFISKILVGMPAAIGGIEDFFVRHEAQTRGSMHAHGMGYTAGAPLYDEKSPASLQAVCDFVDKYITCSSTAVPSELLQLQIHTHNRHCRRPGNRCKADFPRPPMASTTILHPMERDALERPRFLHLRNQRKRIRQAMEDLVNEMKTGHNRYSHQCILQTYQEFLQALDMPEDEYFDAIRFALDRPTVFLKRRPCEILINNYNPIALCLWRANMDLQYVVNPYAAASYAAAYMTKTDHTTSVLMEATLSRMAAEPEAKLPDMIRAVGNAFINAQEVTAQEACYLILGLPLRVSTRATYYINTRTPDERHVCLRNKHELQQLPADSTDVCSPSRIDHYTKRPAAMENVCLADFIACYSHQHESTNQQRHVDSNPVVEADGEADELLPESAREDGFANLPRIAGKYKISKHRRILRWKRYDKETQQHEYCRSMLMLFSHWRDENAEITFEAARLLKDPAKARQVHANYRRYNVIDNIDSLEQHARDNMSANDEEDAEATNTRTSMTATQQFIAVDLHDSTGQALENVNTEMQYDILQDLEASIKPTTSTQAAISSIEMTVLPQHAYHSLINSLNSQQRQLHDHVLFVVKENAPAWQSFISGGAGVGKSHLLRAIDESIKRWYLRMPGHDFTKTPVAIIAPTGTAAFNVRGLTIHAALAIPPNRDLAEFEFLTFEKANTLRTAWANVQLLIIDEVSMVGNRMLHTINIRLQQLRGSSLPFGGLSILAFGDLYQLKPVMDGWVFNPLQGQLAALAPHTWQNFKLYELTQVMRQRERGFIDRLNRLRTGSCTVDDIEWYLLHETPANATAIDPAIPHLFLSNKKVHAHNSEFLTQLPGALTTISCIDNILNPPSDRSACSSIYERIDHLDSTKTSGLMQTLHLKLNAPVELTYNIDVSDGLTNGVTATVCNWSTTADGQVATIYVQFPNAACGKKARAAHSSETRKLGIHTDWTPIQRSTIQFKLSKVSHVNIQRQQFALRVCAARTIHRVQGQSLQTALIDLAGRSQAGMHYVGISRIITESGLHLRNFRRRDIHTSPEVTQEYQRMRNDCLLQLALPQLQQKGDHHFIVTALNARSLHANIDNVRSDCNILQSNLLLITETWASAADNDVHYAVADFDMFRMDNTTHSFDQRPHRGIIAFYKNCTFHPCYNLTRPGCDILGAAVTTPYLTVNVITVYRCPQLAMSEFLNNLSACLQCMPSANPCMILGDFNVDIKGITPDLALDLALQPADHHLKILVQFMLQHNFAQMLEAATVDSGMQIDHIWSDIPTRLSHFHQQPFVLESFYSDHRPIGLQLTATDS